MREQDGGVMQKECEELVKKYFAQKRHKNTD